MLLLLTPCSSVAGATNQGSRSFLCTSMLAKHWIPFTIFQFLSFTSFSLQGRELMGNDVKGALCMSTSIPSMSRTIYGHHQRFLDTYYNPFKGIVFHLMILFLFCSDKLISLQQVIDYFVT